MVGEVSISCLTKIHVHTCPITQDARSSYREVSHYRGDVDHVRLADIVVFVAFVPGEIVLPHVDVISCTLKKTR